ncbi:hypothetical protein NQ314_015264 [Rhamnusium bicolor]|uniref:Uncharacterized protein n=1 Tax=Rhamnusium bicolor TaxID=1586634 RepID=A0AAV8WZH2_9CUCU|nr:hypothetical protein NQ314_015264 [Rhamnusium bicolor]
MNESTRQQEHEAAYGLLSLSQKPTKTSTTHSQSDIGLLRSSSPVSNNDLFMSTEEIAYVSKTSYAKNKILDEHNSLSFSTTTKNNEVTTFATSEETAEAQNIRNYLGKSSVNRPLTYPYTSALNERDVLPSNNTEIINRVSCNETVLNNVESSPEPKCIKQFHVIQKYAVPLMQPLSPKISVPGSPSQGSPPPKKLENTYSSPEKSVNK